MKKTGTNRLFSGLSKIGVALLATAVLLSACGKRSDEDSASTASGAPQFNANGELISGSGEPGLGAAVSKNLTVRLASDVRTIPTGGTDVATLTAYVTNASNRAVAGQTVELSSDAGVLQGISDTTDENGEASATLSLARDLTNRDITVTVTVGDATDSLTLQATGTRLIVEEPLSDAVSDDVELNTRFLAGDDSPIANQTVSFTSSAGNVITPATAITDAAGQVLARVVAPQGNDVITATAFDGDVSAQYRISVSNEQPVTPVPVSPPQVRVISDRSFIATGTSDVATITTLVTNERNQAVAGQAIEVSASGGVLQAIDAVTDENGEATAKLGLVRDFQNRDIEVAVEANGVVNTVVVQASGTQLEVTGPSALVTGNTARLIATLQAGNDEPIANRPLVFSSTAGNVITPTTVVTDNSGRAEVQVTTNSGDDVISVSALDGTVSGSHSFKVASDLLTFADGLDGIELEVGEDHDIAVTWESQGQPVIDNLLRFGITAGRVASPTVMTDASGTATAQVRSSSAGPAIITVEDNENGDPATQIGVEFVARQPASVALDSSSTRVQTRDTSTLTARVIDSNGNPVKGREVVFGGNDLRGGQLNPASAVTNSSGEAAVVFTAGGLPTEVDEIELQATVKDTSISASTRLTVAERRLNVTIGTSSFIEERASATQYAIPFVVQVADGSGAPLKDAAVEIAMYPLEYYKGELFLVDSAGNLPEPDKAFTADHWSQFFTDRCESEDVNRDRVLGPTEDDNGNGALDPQDPALAAPIESSENLATLTGNTLRTDEKGSGYFDMIYPASTSLWAKVRITARARAFNVEAEASFDSYLPVLAERLRNTNANPPNISSPYNELGACDSVDG